MYQSKVFWCILFKTTYHMKRLNLIAFASVFQRQEEEAIREAHSELFATLDKNFDVNVILQQDFKDEEMRHGEDSETLTALLIATGGTEGMVVRRYAELPKPLVLLTDGKANSLAASLELACWSRQQGDSCKIIHGEMDYVVDELNNLYGKDADAIRTTCSTATAATTTLTTHCLEGLRIGVVGEPSEWLVSSDVDYAAAKERWGVEFVDIPLKRVEELYAQDTDEGTTAVEKFINEAQGCVEPTREDIVKAMRLYRALKRLSVEEGLAALTLQCFSLIPTTGTTGCLALALLNDEGIVAGCEGDLQTIFTLLLAKRLTGKDGFMANPSRIDTKANTIILAHCTIGLSQTRQYIIRSHFESQSGVAIQGILNEGEVTIIKCGGKDLSLCEMLHGRIIENQDDPLKCRTQLFIECDSVTPVSYFLERNIGNHHVILQGNVTL